MNSRHMTLITTIFWPRAVWKRLAPQPGVPGGKLIMPYIAQDKRLLRPINFPPGTPGWGASQYETARGQKVVVVNVMCRLFMDALDDPSAPSMPRSPNTHWAARRTSS